jgi:hypothetical protein
MYLYSELINIDSNTLSIHLPNDFQQGKALITIIPMEKPFANDIADKRKKFKKLIQHRPFQLSKDEIKKFEENSKWVREWK